jgi:hypothetical protein
MNFRNFISRVLCLYLIGLPSSYAYTTNYFDWRFVNYTKDKDNLFYCPVESDQTGMSSILNVAESVEFDTCFKKRNSFTEKLDKTLTADEDLSLIGSDLEACKCLEAKASKNKTLADILEKGSETKVDSSKIPVQIRENYKDAVQENGKVVFDASIICGGDKDCTKLFVSNNVQNILNQKEKDFAQSQKNDKSPHRLITSTSLFLNVANYFQDLTPMYLDIARKSKNDVKVDAQKYSQSLIEEQALAPGQCVSGREFIAFSQKKSFEDIAGDLASLDLNHFDPSEWDFKKLREKYDALISESPSEKLNNKGKIDKIKNKLIFLNYNPLVKTFFTIDPMSDNSNANPRDGVPPEFYKEDNVLKKKKELLSVLKNFAIGNSDGVCSINGCMSNVTNQKKLESFNKSLFDFFVRPDIGRATKKQSDNLTYDILFKKDQKKKSDLPLSQRAIVQSYMNDFPDRNPDDCGANGVDVKCALIFGGYCKKINSIKHKIYVGIPDSMPDDLDARLENSFNPDIKTNLDLKAFNKETCDKNLKFDNSEMSFNNYMKSNCIHSSLVDCRSEFFKRTKNASSEDVKNFIVFQENASLKGVSNPSDVIKTAYKINSDTEYNDWDDWNEVRENNDLSRISGNGFGLIGDMPLPKRKDLDPSVILPQDGASSSLKKDDPMAGDSLAGKTPFVPDYSILSPGNSVAQQKASEKQKIENMSNERKKSLLNDWENEYDEWKKSKKISDSSELSPADSVKDDRYKKEIQTLKALLEEQKKLTDTQSKLLNDAISRKSESPSTERDLKANTKKDRVVSAASEFSPSKMSNSSFTNNSGDSASRSPASIGDGGRIGNISNNSSAARSTSSSVKSFSRSSENTDSLAREQAKLINVKNYSDGSILVESPSSLSSAVNAISLPVSDEQYKVLLVNPTDLSLGQIEKSIPPEQISKLEKSGEITLLLKNGSNPPFEVKVSRVDNKLVYSLKDKDGKDQAPIRRVHTRQALESQLKVQ